MVYKFYKNLKVFLWKITEIRELLLIQRATVSRDSTKNPLNKFGLKCFSQNDEDGITMEILRRIGILENGVFAEFGVGNGFENNTLILAALGWSGFWVGGEELDFNVKNKSRFCYIKDWITLEKIVPLTEKGLKNINKHEIDVISLDLDGNDYYLVERLLENKYLPKLFILEYNAKFIPPVQFKIRYDERYQWKGSDYFGASLATFCSLLSRFDYKLVCCNSDSGSNAFFVQNEYVSAFEDIPSDIRDIYVAPCYLKRSLFGHPTSRETIEKIFE